MKNKKCGAMFRIDDDTGESCCTFHCGLLAGHSGHHQEHLGDKDLIVWEKDMREKCQKCGKMSETVPLCKDCYEKC